MLLKNFRAIEFKEKKIKIIDENELTAFLFKTYGMMPYTISQNMNDDEMALMHFQIGEAIDQLTNLGFNNFALLTEKFNPGFIIFNSYKDADRCKNLIERILFVTNDQSTELNEFYAEKYADYDLDCGPGCLDNLSEILQDMTSIRCNFHDVVISEKKKLVKYALNQLMQQGTFNEILRNTHKDMEIHNVKYLFNAIAKKMGLKQEDVQAEFSNIFLDLSEHQKFIYGQIKNAFKKRACEESLIDNITDIIIKSLPSQLEELDSNAEKMELMQEHLKYLKIPVKDVSIYHFLNIDEDYIIWGYKENLRSSIHAIVTTFFHEKNIIVDPDLEFTKQIFAINSQTEIPKSLVGEYSPNRIWDYICLHDLLLDSQDFGSNSAFELMNEEQIRSFLSANRVMKGQSSHLYVLGQEYEYDFSKNEKALMLFDCYEAEQMMKLLKLNPELNLVRKSSGYSALTHHLLEGNLEIASLLKSHGAVEISIRERIFTSLKFPSESMDEHLIADLTKYPNLFNAVNSEGDNALHMIFRQKSRERLNEFLGSQMSKMEKALLQENNKGETALALAVQNGEKKLTLSLIKHLSDCGINFSQQTNLIGASLQRQSFKIFEALTKLKNFGELLLQKNDRGQTFLHYCFGSEKTPARIFKIVEKIMEMKPYAAFETDFRGFNIAHYAAGQKSTKALEFVFEHAPHLLEQKDQEKATPICIAVRRNLPKNIHYILSKASGNGVIFAKHFDNANLLHLAIAENAKESLDYLLKLPFDVIEPLLMEKTDLNTPHEYALQYGKLEFALKIQQKMDKGFKKQCDDAEKEKKELGKFSANVIEGTKKRGRSI